MYIRRQRRCETHARSPTPTPDVATGVIASCSTEDLTTTLRAKLPTCKGNAKESIDRESTVLLKDVTVRQRVQVLGKVD